MKLDYNILEYLRLHSPAIGVNQLVTLKLIHIKSMTGIFQFPLVINQWTNKKIGTSTFTVQ